MPTEKKRESLGELLLVCQLLCRTKLVRKHNYKSDCGLGVYPTEFIQVPRIMSVSPLDILVPIMSSINTDMRASFALSSLLVYDSVINLDKEVRNLSQLV